MTIKIGIAGKGGVGVNAAFFHRNKMRAQIALFESQEANALRFCPGPRRLMQRTAVAKAENGIERVILPGLFQPAGELFWRLGEGQIRTIAAVKAITAVKDNVYRFALQRFQPVSDIIKERPHRSLQQQIFFPCE